jgi:pyruvate formate lyase activating enzyme
MNGMITEIQRFSLNDGPGIRTTIFLKGCNMNCLWCHNPETIKMSREIHYYEKNCVSCYHCVRSCPSKAHKRIGGVHHFYPKLCVKCGKCTEICYAEAMVMSGKDVTVLDVMSEIIQDKAYYINSGGGITISGGEVLCQINFAKKLTDACHEEGIKVAIETNLLKPWDEIEPLLKKLDLIMCDIKLFDTNEHSKWTGKGNEIILENIKKLSDIEVPFIVRTPLIPTATDSDENIASIAEFLSYVKGLEYYELLNFNPLGDTKYMSLSKENPFKTVRPLSANRMKELRQLAEGYGIAVRTD